MAVGRAEIDTFLPLGVPTRGVSVSSLNKTCHWRLPTTTSSFLDNENTKDGDAASLRCTVSGSSPSDIFPSHLPRRSASGQSIADISHFELPCCHRIPL